MTARRPATWIGWLAVVVLAAAWAGLHAAVGSRLRGVAVAPKPAVNPMQAILAASRAARLAAGESVIGVDMDQPAPTSQSAAVLSKLRTPVAEWAADDAPLSDVVQRIREGAGVPVVVDWHGLDQKVADLRVSLRVRQGTWVTVLNALVQALRSSDAAVTCVVKNGWVQVTTLRIENLRSVVYDLSDIVQRLEASYDLPPQPPDRLRILILDAALRDLYRTLALADLGAAATVAGWGWRAAGWTADRGEGLENCLRFACGWDLWSRPTGFPQHYRNPALTQNDIASELEEWIEDSIPGLESRGMIFGGTSMGMSGALTVTGTVQDQALLAELLMRLREQLGLAPGEKSLAMPTQADDAVILID